MTWRLSTVSVLTVKLGETRDPIRVALDDGALAVYLENVPRNVRGSAFVHLGRTLDMIELGFGSDVPVAGFTDPDRRLPSHVFHVQCPFRLDSAFGAVVGSRDMYIDPLLGTDTPDEFDWRPHGSNTFDAATASFFEAHPPWHSDMRERRRQQLGKYRAVARRRLCPASVPERIANGGVLAVLPTRCVR